MYHQSVNQFEPRSGPYVSATQKWWIETFSLGRETVAMYILFWALWPMKNGVLNPLCDHYLRMWYSLKTNLSTMTHNYPV